KTVPKFITQEVRESRYIKTTSRVDKIDGESVPKHLKRRYKLTSLYTHIPTEDSWDGINIESSMKLRKILIKLQNHEEAIKKFEANLTQVLYSYSNSKKLLEAVPELKNHFGNDVTSMAIVPASQIINVREGLAKPR